MHRKGKVQSVVPVGIGINCVTYQERDTSSAPETQREACARVVVNKLHNSGSSSSSGGNVGMQTCSNSPIIEVRLYDQVDGSITLAFGLVWLLNFLGGPTF